MELGLCIIGAVVTAFLLFTPQGRKICLGFLVLAGAAFAYWGLVIYPQVQASNLAYHQRTIAETVAKCIGHRDDASAPKWQRQSLELKDQTEACDLLYYTADPEDGGDAFHACVDEHTDKQLGEFLCVDRIIVVGAKQASAPDPLFGYKPQPAPAPAIFDDPKSFAPVTSDGPGSVKTNIPPPSLH